MNRNGIAVGAALLVALAAPAMAGGGSTGLTVGGRTLAGPGTSKLAMNATETVYTHPATNTNACGTLAAKGSAARLTLVGANTSAIDVPANGTASLCMNALVRVDLTCLGTSACIAQWRIDAN